MLKSHGQTADGRTFRRFYK